MNALIKASCILLLLLSSCSKDELPRSNPLDITDDIANSTNGLPAVSDGSVEQIYANGAIFSGEVYSEGCSAVYERGLCYNYSGNPSVSFNILKAGGGKGTYQCTFSGLLPGYTYFFRAYAKNDCGIAYGNVYSFTTPDQ